MELAPSNGGRGGPEPGSTGWEGAGDHTQAPAHPSLTARRLCACWGRCVDEAGAEGLRLKCSGHFSLGCTSLWQSSIPAHLVQHQPLPAPVPTSKHSASLSGPQGPSPLLLVWEPGSRWPLVSQARGPQFLLLRGPRVSALRAHENDLAGPVGATRDTYPSVPVH